MSGRVLDLSGSGLRVRVPLPIPCGAPVKVETSETLMLGEVCRCDPVEGAYEAGLMVAHVLTALADLRRLNQALLDEDSPANVGETPTEVRTRS